MQNNFFCNNSYINLYERPSFKSKIGSQILYGEKFKILKKEKNFIKIKTKYDHYVGYIKSSKYKSKFAETHKVSVLRSRIFKYPKNLQKFKSNNFLSFSSKIQVLKKKNNFVMFDSNKWLYAKDVKLVNKKDSNILDLQKILEEKTGLNVSINNKKNNIGTISFEYQNLDQLDKLINTIKNNY